MPVRPAGSALRLEFQDPEPRPHTEQPHQPRDESSAGNRSVCLLRPGEVRPIYGEREQGRIAELIGFAQEVLPHQPAEFPPAFLARPTSAFTWNNNRTRKEEVHVTV